MSSTPAVSTSHAVSPDSGLVWTEPGAWPVADGVHRIPLPLPNDGLKAVNVYAIEADSGLTLIDGGWVVASARDVLEQALRSIGHSIRDIRAFLVTHVHRDHYTMASALGKEFGATVTLGRGEEPALDLINDSPDRSAQTIREAFKAAGLPVGPDRSDRPQPNPDEWRQPDVWIDHKMTIPVGERELEAVPTPGHTPGHVVFAERAAGLLFAGDHVLPTITPSIGFTFPTPDNPLGSFLASLERVRALPDLRLLPAHGPVTTSVHARVHDLLALHQRRLVQCESLLTNVGRTAAEVAAGLGWTRHERSFASLDQGNQRLAALETKAHLDLLVVLGRASCSTLQGTAWYATAGTDYTDPSEKGPS